jgi:hypothetical protein
MKLNDQMLNVTGVVSAPLVIAGPEADWLAARDSGKLPKNVFSLYEAANFFSLDAAPRFLDDDDKWLFSFLTALVRGTRECLVEAQELLGEIQKSHGLKYTPAKRARGEKYDRDAAGRQMRDFKYLIISLASALDQFAEIVGLLFTKEIDRVTCGRASFVDVKRFAATPLVGASGIVSPKKFYLEKLHAKLALEVVGKGAESGWIDLFYLYRNKLAHLGDFMFDKVELHDKSGEFFTFLPRKWLQPHRSRIKPSTDLKPRGREEFKKYIKNGFIHVDITEYSQRLVEKVKKLLDAGFGVLTEAYVAFRDFDLNVSALQELRNQSESSPFKFFPD